MDSRIADTFTDSLARLIGEEQKAVAGAHSGRHGPRRSAEVYDTERHSLYVACTRARDHLLVTGVSPASEFLKDLGA